MKFAVLMTTLAAIALIPAFALADQEWVHAAEQDGVQLFRRDAQDLGGIAFRGVLHTDVPIDKIVPIFIDADERQHWVHRYAEEELISAEEPTNTSWEERYWTRVDLPFPASDRDYVFHTVYEFHPDEKQVTAHVQSVQDDRYPPRDCCERARSNTLYTLTALPNGGTRLEVEVEVDLGGNLPGFITRGAQRDWPAITLTSLVERSREADRTPDPRVEDW